MRRNLSWLPILALSMFAQLPAAAQTPTDSDAAEFHELLRSTVDKTDRPEEIFSRIHMLPDQNVLAATQSTSIQDALAQVNKSSLSQLVQNTATTLPIQMMNADSVLQQKNHPVTIVIAPGIFGEFIKTHAFQEVFTASSDADQKAFANVVAEAKLQKDPNATDLSFHMNILKEVSTDLSDLILVGSLKDQSGKVLADKNGQPLVRVILFATPALSLESMGTLGVATADGKYQSVTDSSSPLNMTNHAGMFLNRLEKYRELMGETNRDMILVGYSRGTDLALEMLAQAKERKLPFLSHIKGMIALGGVTWGSTLADDALNPNSDSGKLVIALEKLRNTLSSKDRLMTDITNWLKFAIKNRHILGAAAEANLKGSLATAKEMGVQGLPPAAIGLDFGSLASMAKMILTDFIAHPMKSAGQNVARFQTLVDNVIAGVTQLSTQARMDWWKSRTLPTINYYAITAAMPDPKLSDTDKQVFEAGYGYSKPNSFDDINLLGNRTQYAQLQNILIDGQPVSSGPVALNDSQVSMGQVMFLPNLQRSLNPANDIPNSRFKFLGTLGTHHWGLALQVVNQMRDNKGDNPYPRESLLKALAAKAVKDLQ